ncbi:glycosyltransferase [Fictibacillus macauensis ZFHKF-1]|uniref:Glycosyltransferase n=1 Tax=Fictibacillus macauensis ZFHKF-1 TaxID=1196324 RepID=I8IWY3_9BACL|nr:glycosyltransferase family 4 protein [Fictibacillus macauensis]EIT83971.1 glycosyltransferase [Fictibacillus macauensis ZFHKF-1]
MAKILILTNNDVGLYNFRRELVENLTNNHEVIISMPDGKFTDFFAGIGCKVINTHLNNRGTNPLEDFKLYKEYRKIIKYYSPEVVLTYTIKPNIFGGFASRFNNVPYIANITGLGSAVENKGPLKILTTNLYKFALKKAKKVFFQNESNLEFFLSNKIVNGNTSLLPGSGVNLKYYTPQIYPESETVNFLFVARIMKEKGIEQLLEAAKVIRVKYPQTRFHVVGPCDEDYSNILKELEQKSIIIYHGFQYDLREFYRNSHCIIHPTYYPEGMSNVLLESAASGRPIITTNRPGCKEIVDDTVNGYLIKEKISADLIEKIELFLKLDLNNRKHMGLKGREKVQKFFDRDIIVNSYLKEVADIE